MTAPLVTNAIGITLEARLLPAGCECVVVGRRDLNQRARQPPLERPASPNPPRPALRAQAAYVLIFIAFAGQARREVATLVLFLSSGVAAFCWIALRSYGVGPDATKAIGMLAVFFNVVMYAAPLSVMVRVLAEAHPPTRRSCGGGARFAPWFGLGPRRLTAPPLSLAAGRGRPHPLRRLHAAPPHGRLVPLPVRPPRPALLARARTALRPRSWAEPPRTRAAAAGASGSCSGSTSGTPSFCSRTSWGSPSVRLPAGQGGPFLRLFFLVVLKARRRAQITHIAPPPAPLQDWRSWSSTGCMLGPPRVHRARTRAAATWAQQAT